MVICLPQRPAGRVGRGKPGDDAVLLLTQAIHSSCKVATDTLSITRSRIIYAALLVFTLFGGVMDMIIYPRYGERYSPNDLIQTIGVWLLLCVWVSADKARLQKPLGAGWRLAIVLLMPLGLAFWLFLSRPWPRALGMFVVMMAGCVLALFCGLLLGEYLDGYGLLAAPRRWLGIA